MYQHCPDERNTLRHWGNWRFEDLDLPWRFCVEADEVKCCVVTKCVELSATVAYQGMFVCDFSLSLPRQVWGDAASANNLFVLTKMQGAQNGRRTLSNHSLVLALVSLYLSPLPFCQVAGVESSCLRRCLFVSGLTGMMYYRSVGQRSQAAARS